MSIDRSELPTQARLQELREEGFVPYSPVAARCLTVMALVAGAALVTRAGWWGEFIADLQRLWRTGLTDPAYHPIARQMSDRALWSAALLGGVVATFALLGVQLQTRFLNRGIGLGLDLKRLNPFRALTPVSFIGRVALRAALALLTLACAAALASVVARPLLLLLNYDLRYFAAWGRRVPGEVAPSIVIAAAGLALLARAAARVGFLYEHRMNREEVVREERRR